MPTPARTPEPSGLVQLLLIPVLYYIGAKLSLAFAIMPDVLVMVWIPNGILLAAFLHCGLRRYVHFAACILVAEIAADYADFTLIEAILFGMINLLEAIAAYLLLRRWSFNPVFATPGDLGKFLLAGPIIGAFAAACGAAAVYRHFGGAEMSYLQYLRVWWFSDGLGVLMITPLVLSVWPVRSHAAVERMTLRWYDGVVASLALVWVSIFLMSDKAAFNGWPVRPVQLLPFVLYAAVRLTPRGTTMVVALYAGIVLFVTKNGQQPYGDLPIQQTILEVQQFVTILAIAALGLASLLAQLRANTRQLELRVAGRTAELRLANEQLQRLAVTDPLTGVANRRAVLEAMQREIEHCRRHSHDLAVIIFDIDRFKDVNDRYGHAAGDRVIRHVADTAARAIRSTDTLARYGGEEFVLVAPQTDKAQALLLAERIRAAVQASGIAVGDDALRVTASFGVAMLRAGETDPESVLHRADRALYAAKAAGRDRVFAEAEELARAP